MTKRPFNQAAYNAHDKSNKMKLIALMERKNYALVGNADEENYKKYDLKFTNSDGKELSFENETRKVFDTIKNVYKTIHIPIRKKNTQADFYIVWNPSMTEMILIDRETIARHSSAPVEVECKEGHVNFEYKEEFIDVPKSEATFYKEVEGKWIKQ